MKIKPSNLSMILLILLFGGILAGSSLGIWKTESSKEPARYIEGIFEGSYNPKDIRGSYTFEEISTLFEIPIEDLANAFQLSPEINAFSFQCKGLESLYSTSKENGFEVGTDSVRMFVALYKGLPYELDGAYLPESAADILRNLNILTEEQSDYLEAHTVNLFASDTDMLQTTEFQDNNEESQNTDTAAIAEKSNIGTDTVKSSIQAENVQETPSYQPENDEKQSTEKLVKGNTTFREVLDWGLSKESIEEILGSPIPNPAMTIRDFCTQEGIEFSEIKASLQQMLDQ